MQLGVRGAKGEIGNVDETLQVLRDYCEENECEGQILNADMVFGESHIISACEHAIRAFDEERNSSKSLGTEIMLYASGERQISEAIEKMGIVEGTKECVVVLIGEADSDELIEKLGMTRDDSVLKGDAKNLEVFGISEQEKGTLPEDKIFDLVLERVAMVDLLK